MIRPTQEQVEQIGHGQTEEIIIGCSVHSRVPDDDHTDKHIPQYASYEDSTENDCYLQSGEKSTYNDMKWGKQKAVRKAITISALWSGRVCGPRTYAMNSMVVQLICGHPLSLS